MENISFLKEILMSSAEYWIVALKREVRDTMELKRIDDDIVFIAIPQGIKRGLKYEEVTLKELEKLQSCTCIGNIYLTGDYPPFQHGINFYHMYKGYPVKKNIKQFAIKALQLQSPDLFKYQELIEK